ncbi:hypothetical protein DLAC_00891 [Tieghemostelium lacteum]|uniref:Armadillo-like helical domain-containing protein n=1 Tax=Tieghemostelium lacteum TaxID=361077 RepID=A0A152A7I4_TIELA|nr:hypothetical protein DLAC_00891 [Tieghemostelium lacteum]|eukprot:KYR02091.1 hypothetical protein DLAC_00891 [Tieghemostelium lacteum]
MYLTELNYLDVKRTEIPFYSDRLNKRIQDTSIASRITGFLNSGDETSIKYALDTLLSKSFQEKLNLSTNSNEFSQNSYVTVNLLDSIMRTVARVEKVTEDTYQLKFSTNSETVQKVIAILRNSILQPGNDQVIALNATCVEFLIEVAHNYLSFKRSLSTLNTISNSTAFIHQNLYNITSNFAQYLLEIFSKIITRISFHLPTSSVLSDQLSHNNNSNSSSHTSNVNRKYIFEKTKTKTILLNGKDPELVLNAISKDSIYRIIRIIEMSIYTFDNDDELLASLETLELFLQSNQNRSLLKDIVFKPIFQQFLVDNNTTNSNNNNNNNHAKSSKNYSINPVQIRKLLDQSNLIGRLVELLGHLNNAIQLTSLNILLRLNKCSHKLRIMTCHYSGLIRHLCNLLSLKVSESNHNEISKRSVQLLFYLSKETLNLPILQSYETAIAQIALSDNPHIDTLAKILVKLESYLTIEDYTTPPLTNTTDQ